MGHGHFKSKSKVCVFFLFNNKIVYRGIRSAYGPMVITYHVFLHEGTGSDGSRFQSGTICKVSLQEVAVCQCGINRYSP